MLKGILMDFIFVEKKYIPCSEVLRSKVEVSII